MPVEGISMTTVFSLIAAGLALALSTYIGGYYLRLLLDTGSLLSSVAMIWQRFMIWLTQCPAQQH